MNLGYPRLAGTFVVVAAAALRQGLFAFVFELCAGLIDLSAPASPASIYAVLRLSCSVAGLGSAHAKAVQFAMSGRLLVSPKGSSANHSLVTFCAFS